MRRKPILFCLGLIVMELSGNMQVFAQGETAVPSAPAVEAGAPAPELTPPMRVAIIGEIRIRDFPASNAAMVLEEASMYIDPNGAVGISGDGAKAQATERMLARGFEKLADWMKEGGNPIGPTFVLYYDDPRTTPLSRYRFKIGYPAPSKAQGFDSVRIEQLPAHTAAVAQFAGPFSQSMTVRDSLADWIAAQGYEPAGPFMEVYLRGMRDSTRPEENFGEIRWPVRRRGASIDQAVPARGGW